MLSKITITPAHIYCCATERQIRILVEKAAIQTEYMSLLGEGFEYHSYDEHVVIAKAFCLTEVAELFQAAVDVQAKLNSPQQSRQC